MFYFAIEKCLKYEHKNVSIRETKKMIRVYEMPKESGKKRKITNYKKPFYTLDQVLGIYLIENGNPI